MLIVTIFMIVLNRLVYFQRHEIFYIRISIGDVVEKNRRTIENRAFQLNALNHYIKRGSTPLSSTLNSSVFFGTVIIYIYQQSGSMRQIRKAECYGRIFFPPVADTYTPA